MKVEQIYTGCLAEAAYYIESNGEVAIIDPLRETAPYIERAKKDNAVIKYIFETHYHADFVSGHVDLANRTGATIVYGPNAGVTGFEKEIAKDGQFYQLGDISFEVIHTPGHTMESTCLLLRNEADEEVGLFSGDTLFIGDVGRPDLAQEMSSDLNEEKLARLLYQSLRTKILPLADNIIVYPAHGKGSACGKNMSSETTDTLGNQKKTNYALAPDLTEDQFVEKILTGLSPAPKYFPQNVALNIQGYSPLEEVLKTGSRALSPEEFEQVANEREALILDTRSPDEFRDAHVAGSIFIGIDGDFAPWVGALVPDIKQPILLITDEKRTEEVITRLARVGYDNTIGFLAGGMAAWQQAGKEIDRITSINPSALAELDDPQIIDVRRKSEFDSEHIHSAVNAPLDYINDNISLLNSTDQNYIHCAGGYRSLIFSSILQARGHRNLIDIRGGFQAIKESDKFHLSAFVCPSTLT
ncbi:MBL fold metallo-hydrolase [Chitinophagales bacterium]|nr:MBL fold metallo-hydrolase [Chitinophagales bacterium]